MKLKQFDDLYSLESFLASKGYLRQLNDIIELERQDLIGKPKRSQRAGIIVLSWWNSQDMIVNHPTIKSHRLSYFLFWHLKKELEKSKE